MGCPVTGRWQSQSRRQGPNATVWSAYPTAPTPRCSTPWQNPERVDVLVLVSPTAIRPAAGDAKGDAADTGSAPARRAVSHAGGVRPGGPLGATGGGFGIYRERIPNCNIAFVYAAGHDIAGDRPQALVNLVSDYLERRETFIVQNRSSVINP